jgi:hypothetical protein
MTKTKAVSIVKEKCNSLKTKISAPSTVCASCGTQIASERPSSLELVTNICCVVLLTAVIFPAAHGIARYLDHVIQDVPIHIRSPELLDRWRFEL